MPSSGKTLYALLAVATDADTSAIDAAYQRLLLLYEDVPNSDEKRQRLQQLAEAHQRLSDPLRRKIYDATLAGDGGRVELHADSAAVAVEAPPPPIRGKWPELSGRQWAVIGFIVLCGVYVATQLYISSLYQQTAVSAQQRVQQYQQQQMEQMLAAERYDPATGAAEAAEREQREARYRAEREQAQRDAAFEKALDEHRRRNEQQAQQEEREAERAAERLRSEEGQRQSEQESNSRRLSRERSDLLHKLVREKRYDEARQLAESEHDFDYIRDEENNAVRYRAWRR